MRGYYYAEHTDAAGQRVVITDGRVSICGTPSSADDGDVVISAALPEVWAGVFAAIALHNDQTNFATTTGLDVSVCEFCEGPLTDEEPWRRGIDGCGAHERCLRPYLESKW